MKILSVLILTLALCGSAEAGIVHIAAHVVKAGTKVVTGTVHVAKKIIW